MAQGISQTQPEEQTETIEEERGGSPFSPEGIMMLGLAVILDLIGLADVIPVIGNIISFASDIVGIIFIGWWIWFRSGTMAVTARATTRLAKYRWLRILCFVGEFIPYVGILPLWTLVVFFELKR